MSKILKLLDKYIGISKNEKINGNLAESLETIVNDQLDLKEPLFLVTDNFQFLFEKLRKKLENTIKNKEVKNLKKLFKDLFGTAVAKENKSYITDTISRNLKNKSLNKLKKYNLSHILLEISINSNKEQKTIINEIMFMMTEIFLEFLQYIESLSIDEVGMNLFELRKVYSGNTKDFERLVIEEVIKRGNTNIRNFSSGMLKHRYYEYKEQLENKYIEKFKQIWKNGNSISCFFFKFLQVIDNVELKNLTLQIIYRLNNQQKIYYENVSNYVVFYNDNDFDKFFEIKNLFVNMFNNIRNINLVKRLDRSTFKLYGQLKKLFKKLIRRHENNVLNMYEDIQLYDDNESDDESDSNSESNKEIEYPIVKLRENEEIIDTTNKNNIKKDKNSSSKNKENKGKAKKNYYLNEKNNKTSNINLLITQQTLYNLGFINLIN